MTNLTPPCLPWVAEPYTTTQFLSSDESSSVGLVMMSLCSCNPIIMSIPVCAKPMNSWWASLAGRWLLHRMLILLVVWRQTSENNLGQQFVMVFRVLAGPSCLQMFSNSSNGFLIHDVCQKLFYVRSCSKNLHPKNCRFHFLFFHYQKWWFAVPVQSIFIYLA